VGMSLLIFNRNFSAALFISLAQIIFSNTLAHELPITAPGVDIQAVINTGASSFRTVVSKTLLPGVILAYDRAIRCVFLSGCWSRGSGFCCLLGDGVEEC
jgi:hypothetical protein